MYDKILAALDIRTSQLEVLKEIAYQDVNYEPTTGKPYIETSFMPVSRINRFCGLDENGKPHLQRYSGVYTLLVCMPEGLGQGYTNEVVNEICEKFEATTDLQKDDLFVTIEKVERKGGYRTKPWFKTPVQVSWYSYYK